MNLKAIIVQHACEIGMLMPTLSAEVNSNAQKNKACITEAMSKPQKTQNELGHENDCISMLPLVDLGDEKPFDHCTVLHAHGLVCESFDL